MLDQVSGRFIGYFEDRTEMLSSELSVSQSSFLFILLLQNQIHVFADVVDRIAVAHRAITVIAKRVR